MAPTQLSSLLPFESDTPKGDGKYSLQSINWCFAYGQVRSSVRWPSTPTSLGCWCQIHLYCQRCQPVKESDRKAYDRNGLRMEANNDQIWQYETSSAIAIRWENCILDRFSSIIRQLIPWRYSYLDIHKSKHSMHWFLLQKWLRRLRQTFSYHEILQAFR